MNAHKNPGFDMDEFPPLSSRSNSTDNSHQQFSFMRKSNVTFNQQKHDFNIKNEFFPALPRFRGSNPESGGSSSLNEIENANELTIGRSSHNPHISSAGKSVDKTMQKHQEFYMDSPCKEKNYDSFGMLGLLDVINKTNPSFAMDIDLTTLGLNVTSSEDIHSKFASPWSDEPFKGEPEYKIPTCYNAQQPPPLNQTHFSKMQLQTLFFIFYSMPKDEAQLYAANELHVRGWFYHKHLHRWMTKVPNMKLIVKTKTYEKGNYVYFEPNSWKTIRMENFKVKYETIEKRPVIPQLSTRF